MNDLIKESRYINNPAYIKAHTEEIIKMLNELADALEAERANTEGMRSNWYKCIETLKAAQAEIAAYKEANPPRMHGEWVVDECDTTDDVPSSAWINFHCSVCNMDYGLDEGQYGWCRDEEIPYHFCPNCGADMRKEKPSERI